METSTTERIVHNLNSPDLNLCQVKSGDIFVHEVKRDGFTYKFEELVILTDPFTTIRSLSDGGVVKNRYDVRPNEDRRTVLSLADLRNVDSYEPQNMTIYLTQLKDAGLI